MPRSRRTLADVRAVFGLKSRGLTDREVSQRTGVPINTIRVWRNQRVPGYARHTLVTRHAYRAGEFEQLDVAFLPKEEYAYLLGVYLGDGCLTRNGTSWSLRITLDAIYPGIIDACCDAIQTITGRRPTPRPNHRGLRCFHVDSTWYPWPRLFPQHGPGRKHQRTIALADWQQDIVDAAPRAFLRGLIHTDGWRGLNRVHVKGKDYAYPRYQFSNRSDDIRKLFTDTCDGLGVKWSRWTRYHVSVAQRESVARLDSFIGPKL
jgi:hypothetical protein